MKERDKKIIAFILVILLGICFGYIIGFTSGASFIINEGVMWMAKQGVDLSLTAGQIADVVLHYKEILASNNYGASTKPINLKT